MKTIALLSTILLLASCASQSGFDNPDFQCSPGQDVGIEAGLNVPRANSAEMSDQREAKFLVQVTNNSHHDFTVVRLRVEQLYREDCPYSVDDAYLKVNELIAEGKDHLFEMPTTGRWTGPPRDVRSVQVDAVVLAVSAELSSGETYHCRYSIPLH